MSIFRCCIGADSRIPNESGRPPTGSHSRNKSKKPAEVFFEIPKPEGQLSTVTDPANSTDHKKRKESRDKEQSRTQQQPPKKGTERTDLDVPDNNGLSRGQNFMKVEKWLRESQKQEQVSIAPGDIANLEDHIPGSRDADVPSEKDRLPQASTGAYQGSSRR